MRKYGVMHSDFCLKCTREKAWNIANNESIICLYGYFSSQVGHGFTGDL
jgi:hypothetical protein